MPRGDRLNWGIADAIPVAQIFESGDLRAVLHYATKYFVNATVTKDDLPKFGTPGALHTFLLLQLGVDFLLSETQRPEAEAGVDGDGDADGYAEQIQQFNEAIKAAKRELAERDRTIAELEQKRREIHAEAHREFAQLDACRKWARAVRSEKIDDESDEPGAIRTVGPSQRSRSSGGSSGDYAGPPKMLGRVVDDDSDEF
jgi:hypothetical protein